MVARLLSEVGGVSSTSMMGYSAAELFYRPEAGKPAARQSGTLSVPFYKSECQVASTGYLALRFFYLRLHLEYPTHYNILCNYLSSARGARCSRAESTTVVCGGPST